MLKITGVNIPLSADFSNAAALLSGHLGISSDKISFARLVRRAVDARKKNQIHYVCSFEFAVKGNESQVLTKCASKKVAFTEDRKSFDDTLFALKNSIGCKGKVYIIGSGPAGLFAAYTLGKAGFCPVLLERGECVEKRTEKVNSFWKTGKFDPTSNVQFGEGGAGTFSDGKLNSGIKDPRCKFVLETFSRFGGGEEILYEAKPHIGSDRLFHTVRNMRREIENMGEVKFGHRLTDIIVENGRLTAIEVEARGEKKIYPCSRLVLALGHSARDTFEMLRTRGIFMEQKPFAMGVRIEHPQHIINEAQYGKGFDSRLPAADYKLSAHLKNGRGVFSFCMCPGGQVVAAASEEGGVCTNGMSLSARDGQNANSAILVNVRPEDFGSPDPLAGVYLQRKIEQAAFKAAGQNYFAPIQLAGDFLKNRPSEKLGDVVPTYLPGVSFAQLESYLPKFITESIREALPIFGRKIRGFDTDGAVLCGPEARSSCPLRMVRSQQGDSNIKGIYPCGEGAGYAGGIMSAAVDGIKTAQSIMEATENDG